ncbi:MAG: DUF1156 domain-containing protein [Bacteriovoracia bacterium]
MEQLRIPKKLIEVALPLDAINDAAQHEKSVRHGHPSSLHLWWARRPMVVARAVIFAQMVNDPGYERNLGRGINREKAQIERERLFNIIRRLVDWESSNDPALLREANEEIRRSWMETCELNKAHPKADTLFNPKILPGFHDPFAGGGALPIEAQRLGLNSLASDLNPVAVLINKGMIEIPQRFLGRAAANPDDSANKLQNAWPGLTGLAADLKYYGNLLKQEAESRIGKYFPDVEIPVDVVEGGKKKKYPRGTKFKAIAWLWTRTVKSPSPAFSNVDVPIASSFVLSAKSGKEAYLVPNIEGDSISFSVKHGVGADFEKARLGTTAGKRNGFICVVSGAPIDYEYVRSEAMAGRLGERLMAVVVEGERGRIYLPATKEMEDIAKSATPTWQPEEAFFQQALGFRVGNYGMSKWSDLFTRRQTLALSTLCELIPEINLKVQRDAISAGHMADEKSLEDGGFGSRAYGEGISTYLAFLIDQLANHLSELCAWHVNNEQLKNTFARQTLSMTWDFAETNPFSESTGSLYSLLDRQVKGVLSLCQNGIPGCSIQADAATQNLSANKVISTDPPYYDNIGYADLSDFFYVWLRKSLQQIYPKLLAPPVVPKIEELVATPDRHGGKRTAETFFLNGMTSAMKRLADQSHPAFPVTIYYAFKQSETTSQEGTHSTGWDTFLSAVIKAGFAISGTWPIRTEQTAALKTTRNALASSIILTCIKRAPGAPVVSRREFIRELNSILPIALSEMTAGSNTPPVAPVDLSQAIIGPGMAVFSKYSAVLEADGSPMAVKTALQIINRFLAEEDFDHDTQFCLQWFEEHGWATGKFGEADVLARAKGTSVDGLRDAGIVESAHGSLKLIKPNDLDSGWMPENDTRVSVWELLHHMIARFGTEGESGAGELLSRAGQISETVRTLAYRLFTTCERKGWAQDAGSYDSLVRAWDSIESSAGAIGYKGTQISLFNSDSVANSTIDQKKSRKKR